MGDDAQMNDDIVLEIFFRLPVKFIFQYRSLSKKWNLLLSDPSFCTQYRRRNKELTSSPQQLLGFFQGSKARYWAVTIDKPEGGPKLSFLPVCKQGMPLISRPFIKKLGFILGCSNGLILCGRHPMTYFVCNPVTNQCFPLPQPNEWCNIINIVIGFYYCQDSHHYLVVRVENRGGTFTNSMYNKVPIETYSSDTRVWKQSILTAPDAIVLAGRWPCTVSNGIFYWLTRLKSIVAYDPNTAVDKLWSIRMPYARTNGLAVPTLTETEFELLQCGYDDDVGFRIFVLRKKLKDYSNSSVIPETEWRQSYVINFKRVPYRCLYAGHPAVLEYPILIAFHPENSKIVFFRKDPDIICYDMESSKMRIIEYVGQVFTWKYSLLFAYFSPQWPASPSSADCVA